MTNARVVAMIDTMHEDAVTLAQNLFAAPKYKLLLPPAESWHEEAAAVVMRTGSLTRQDIEAAVNLKVVGKQGVGLDKVDLVAAEEHGVVIRNTPGVNATAVAELVIAHIFAVARQIVDIGVRQRNGDEFQRHSCSGLQVSGKAVGIIGMGAIGKSVARMLRLGFGCEIYAYDPLLPADAWPELPHRRVRTIQEMLPIVDILTLHVPLLDTTRNLVSLPELRAMKDTSILINHSRGGIVNEDDLVVALREKQLRGVGLDALLYDPPSLAKYGELWSFPNVVTTPHIGATIPQTQSESACAAVRNVWDFFKKEDRLET
ncbi:hypothetical protein LCI18_015190 [Fusarium solani-melongenae]|uniref:Uncharacterized protein n=1 Tax=Fusarium solani subsp. cucurbitae TaxID=2747967 RepID=A0ACD3ZSQ3_FUSSC|nr:hypothetical protein LCI18_015190 [Fusarium solani-melongenae]